MILTKNQGVQIARQANGNKDRLLYLLRECGFYVRDMARYKDDINVIVENSNRTITRIRRGSRKPIVTVEEVQE